MSTSAPGPLQPPRERLINAPLAPVLIAAAIPVLYFLQTLTPGVVETWAFRPSMLVEGGWWPEILTAGLLHGNWGHALLNAVFILAVGSPVARLFPGLRGGMVFFAYYIVCHVVGLLGLGMLQLHSAVGVVGASGAAFGLLGGAVRLMRSPRRVRPLTDRVVVTTSLALLAINLATGLLNIAPGVVALGDESVGIAWEAHAFGYVAGLLLIGPLARQFGGHSGRN